MSRSVEEEVGGFLARWSRRKAAARRGAPEPDRAAPGEPAASPPAAATAAPTRAGEAPAEGRATAEAPPLPDLDSLPDPDTLEAASDLRPFLQPGVPAELRRRALRRMWKVNPIIATPDGLDDYYVVNDFSDAGTVVADLRTLYRVGRGMLAAAEEAAPEPPPAEQHRAAALAAPEPRPADPPAPPEPSAPAEPAPVEPARAAETGLRHG